MKTNSLDAIIADFENVKSKSYIIVVDTNKQVKDTKYNRAKYYGKGVLVVNGVIEDIPFTTISFKCEKHETSWDTSTTIKAKEAKRNAIESRRDMFEIGKGSRSRKKPGSGGSFTTKPRLTRMAMSSLNYELNRPMRDGICIIKK